MKQSTEKFYAFLTGVMKDFSLRGEKIAYFKNKQKPKGEDKNQGGERHPEKLKIAVGQWQIP